MCGRYPVNPGPDSLVPEPALQHKFAWLCGHLMDHAANFATAGLKPAATMECSSWPDSTLNPNRGLVTAAQARVGAVSGHFTVWRLEISRRRWR